MTIRIFPCRIFSRIILAAVLIMAVAACDSSGSDDEGGGGGGGGGSGASAVGGPTIAGHTVARESVLRSIPTTYIDEARNDFEIAYAHTSHGTHGSYGVYGLPGFQAGDDVRFAVSSSDEDGALYFRDGAFGTVSAPDLSNADNDWSGWVDQNRDWLEDPDNADVDIWMWSWCSISDHDISAYLASMQTLINEYGAGGSKVGPGRSRADPVTFIFMTGHAEGDNVGEGRPKNQADLIVDYCRARNYWCIDYYSIDTHAMDGTYYEDTDDNGASAEYDGNFYGDWQESHTLGADWYENRTEPGGSVDYGNHNDQHITANRKAFAFWWVLARVAGWSGN